MSGPLRALVVDDSALFRAAVAEALAGLGAEVVGRAADGAEALAQAAALEPDVITLDVEMPRVGGLEALRRLKARGDRGRVVMVSRHTAEGAEVTAEALLSGAFDFVEKPAGVSGRENRAALSASLAPILEAAGASLGVAAAGPEDRGGAGGGGCGLVLVGCSTGGPDALRRVLPGLRGDLPAPILIAQHMPPGYTAGLARRLDAACEIGVREAEGGEWLQPGEALLAPGGRHLVVERVGGRLRAGLSGGPPVNSCRPSVDVLFGSAFEAAPDVPALAVVLTGMGRDGAEGCALVKDGGGRVIAQHADGCTVYGMPKAVVEAGLADRVVKLGHVAAAVRREVAAT